MADTAEVHTRQRPQLLTPTEFARIADLAWRTDPRKSLSRSVSEATGVSESSVERWLKDENHPAPANRIAEALKLANERMYDNADLLMKVAMTLANTPES
ncbi:hypothetical protein [Asticcacaulis sp. EMRT-3]|uniref:hypothetical protein n=1 Tax=Asticcacaulis sp. EMRT-3 TaxID=3040349 RepID=UPI0024AFC59A|nr:hypothetical protein [Asticcacaulis sp. EMRT-3]MDI7775729.1 hypothetical protein [Asticcacaulis sp. EMRT-3]